MNWQKIIWVLFYNWIPRGMKFDSTEKYFKIDTYWNSFCSQIFQNYILIIFCNPYQNILRKNWCRNHWQIPTLLSNSWNWHFNYFYGSCKIDDTNPFHIKTKCSFFISTSSKYQMYSYVSEFVINKWAENKL